MIRCNTKKMARIAWIIFAALMSLSSLTMAQLTVHFDELELPIQGDAGQFFDGYGSDASAGNWSSQEVFFNTNMFGPGFSYSNVNDVTTVGFLNQWAAVTGVDVGGVGNYALSNSFIDDGAFINIPKDWRASSVFVTNSTFAFLSMQNGDAFAKQFGGDDGNDPDFFKVTFSGFDEINARGQRTDSVDFFLADFRFADNSIDFIVDTWELLDLTALGTARSIGISFDSSDVGKFGINTPVYVAMDQLVLMPTIVLGDINLDGVVDLLDVRPFTELLTDMTFQFEADINQDGLVDLLDVVPFVKILTD